MERFLEYEREASRLELLIIRPIYSFILYIIYGIYGLISGICSGIQFLVVLFTGKRNESLNDFIRLVVLFSIQISAYTSALSDKRPELTPERMRVFFEQLDQGNNMEEFLLYEINASRLELLIIRPIYSIIIGIVIMIYGIIAGICQFIQWFIVLFTGERNEGLNRTIRSFIVLQMQVSAYTAALTDQRPELSPRNLIIHLDKLL